MTTNATPTIVFVHGAFAESASWNSVITGLSQHGVTSVALANPLRSLPTDSDYLKRVVAGISGPVVLVAHSYGGMLISEIDESSNNVTALVYVSAFAPDTGETALDLTGKFPGSSLSTTISNIPLAGGIADIHIDQDKYHHQFMADAPAEVALQAAATQRPITDEALGGGLTVSVPAWKRLPSWFVFGDSDLNIPVEAHRFMSSRADARSTVEVAGASHSVGVSRPELVVEAILDAVNVTG